MDNETSHPGSISIWTRYPWLRRELWIAAGALLTGLVAMPLLIYLAGQLALGPYASGSGGLGRFLRDFYLGLLGGSPAVWWVVMGPYLFLGLLRGALRVSRRYLRTT
jgi:hypothetical protein